MTALNRKSSEPPPPYSSGMLNPMSPYLPAAANAERSTIRSASHFSAFGTSSRSMNSLVVSRSCSCSASKMLRFIALPCPPYRRSLLGERQWPFLGVLRPEQRFDLAHQPGPLGLLVGDRPIVDAVAHSLTDLNGQRRVDRNPLRERQRRLHDSAVGNHLVDHPPHLRVGRRDGITGEQQLERDLAGQVVDDPEHTA